MLPILLTLVTILVVRAPVSAEVQWCKSTDPVVTLNGAEVQILVAIPDQYVPFVNGPIDVAITTPESVTRELVFTDPGFNGHGETVRFLDLHESRAGQNGKSFPVLIEVSIPMDASRVSDNTVVPAQATVITGNGGTVQVVQGTTDRASLGISLTGR